MSGFSKKNDSSAKYKILILKTVYHEDFSESNGTRFHCKRH